MINEDVRHIIEPELTEGETLLWADRPQKHPNVFFYVYLFVFSVAWLTILLAPLFLNIFSSETPIKTDAETPPWVLTILTLVYCFFLLIGFLLVNNSFRGLFGFKKLIYALTNKRALIIDSFMGRRNLSMGPIALSIFERHDHKQLATFTFGSNPYSPEKRLELLKNQFPVGIAPAFFCINNANAVEAMI